MFPRSVPACLGLLAVTISCTLVSCVPFSRPVQSFAPSPAAPPWAGPLAGSLPVPPAPSPAYGFLPPAPSQDGCSPGYLPPFDGQIAWRVAYESAAKGAYHDCASWSRFGRVRPNGKWHRGIDIAAPTGTPVRSAVAGTLSYARDPHGWGLYARVRFTPFARTASGACSAQEPMEFVYAHLREDVPASVIRQPPRPIRAGEIVGRVGCTGNAGSMCSPSPESHLHLSLLRTSGAHDRVDPLPVVGWNLTQPVAAAFSPPLLACPLPEPPLSASSR